MLNLTKQLQKIKTEKSRIIFRKPQPNFQHSIKKIEIQAKKKWFSYKNKL